MATAGVRVLFVGKSWAVPYEVRVCSKVHGLFSDIAQFRPDVIVTSEFIPGALNVTGLEIRKRWIHVNPSASNEAVANSIEACYAGTLYGPHPRDEAEPLVSVYTGTYNTGDFLRDTYQSLKEQTYQNWEWVVVDDGSTDGTWQRLLALADEDCRVRPMLIRHNGKIGNTKDLATRMANGKYLIELDHDDMLTDTAVDEVRKAFDANPDVGMVYTNCASFFADGSPHMFGDAFWKPRYRDTEYRGKVYKECCQPDIYDRFGPDFRQQFGWFLTVGPNHIRAYRAETLRKLGGYNRNLPVADDFDVYARFFLYSKCLLIDKLLYLYRFHDAWSNTTFTRNRSIQDHLEHARWHYAEEYRKFNEKRLPLSTLTEEPKKTLSVVVLDWNTEELTKRCLASIRANYPLVEIILVQNGKHFDATGLADKVLQLETNIGFAAGCNRGAMEATGKNLCFLNSDTVVEAGLFERLLGELENPGVGVVGPYCDHAKPPQGYHAKDKVPADTRYAECLVAVCLAMPRTLFEEVGGFDPRFCNFEDDDLCRRVRLKGLKCAVVGGSWIHHEEHASFSANKVDVEKKIRESEKLFQRKWPQVRVIAITLNERKSLPGFVEQFKGITNDICLLDSGSTDGTQEWARERGIKVAVRAFTNFEEQRNAALKKFSEGADWIVMFDPDERLDSNTLENFWEMVRSDEFDVYLTPLRSKNYDGSYTEWVPKAFLWRNKPEIKWVFPVHEKLIGSLRQAKITNAWITHWLELHDPERRKSMAALYDSLGQDGGDLPEWPILNYMKRDDPRIKKVFLGPKISVVISTYKRKELLRKAVESIKRQDYLAKEIVVVGDNCPEFQPPPGCVSLNLPENHGAGGAVPRNYALMLSGSTWVAYLDDDNQWKPDHLSSLMSGVMDASLEMGVSSMEVDGKALIFDVLEKGKCDTSCLVHRKDLVRRAGWWHDRNVDGYAHDWKFIERLGKEVAGRVLMTKNPTVIYNKDTSGQSEYLAARVASLPG